MSVWNLNQASGTKIVHPNSLLYAHSNYKFLSLWSNKRISYMNSSFSSDLCMFQKSWTLPVQSPSTNFVILVKFLERLLTLAIPCSENQVFLGIFIAIKSTIYLGEHVWYLGILSDFQICKMWQNFIHIRIEQLVQLLTQPVPSPTIGLHLSMD